MRVIACLGSVLAFLLRSYWLWFDMPAKKRKRDASGHSCSHLDAFTVGGIAALAKEGYTQRQIADSPGIRKPDDSVVKFSTRSRVFSARGAGECARSRVGMYVFM